jgi:hypothetical protein
MNREELKKIIEETEGDYGITHCEAANRILAALEDERKGEVVLADVVAGEPLQLFKGRGDNKSVALIPVPYRLVKNKTGKIVLITEDK